MFKSLSSSSRKLHSQLEGLYFSRELLSQPNVTFNATPYPNGGDIIGYDGEISCVSFDAVQSLLAIATKSGRITLYGDFERLHRLTWSLKPALAVNHILLKSGTSYLLAVDAKDTLHVFDIADLDERGEPKRLLSHSMRSRVNSIESTPSLSHIFIACQDGSVDTFDVDRGIVSPYRVKNLWIEQDELLRRSGVPNAPSKKRIPACVEAKSHPLDHNQLLIAFEGGIALYNITERHTIRTYEYIVLPGAPGGHDDQTEGAFLERRPMCTCLAWRPDGRMFAAGYDDGSFALWAIEDGDRPIMARTIFKEDVDLATSSSLFGEDGQEPSDIPGAFREPIYKLAWCGFSDTHPSHKGTILLVLGGLMPNDTKGLHCLHLPTFSPPSIINSSNPKQLRDAYKASIRPNYTSVLPTDTTPEDFVLLTSNPYYSQTHDPYSVLVMLSHDADLPAIAPHTQRGFVAYPFPPSMGVDPVPQHLPMDLHLTGSQAAVWTEAITLSGATRMRLRHEATPEERLPLNGGEAKLIIKPSGPSRTQEKHHAVFTVSQDMMARIWDYTKTVPRLLNQFSARDGLSDEQLMMYIDGRMLVERVSAAWHTTEMAFGLSTGDVLFYKFQYARPEAVRRQEERDESYYRPEPVSSHFHHSSGSSTPYHDSGLAAATSRMGISTPSPKPQHHTQDSQPPSRRLFGRRREQRQHVQEGSSSSTNSTSFELSLQDSAHLSDWSKDGFKPVFGLSLNEDRTRGSSTITALSLSEAGFLAVAWGTKLAILDLRGPEVLFSEAEGRQNGDIVLLTWSICAEGTDPERHPRLLATYQSGLTRIYTLSYVLDTWIVIQQVNTLRHEESRNAIAHFLLDPFGNTLNMDTGSLDQCLRAAEQGGTPHMHHHNQDKAQLNTISIIVAPSALTVFANLSGERLVKREFGQSRAVAAKIVQKYAMPVLAVILDDGQCAILSLPNCEVVRTMQIPYGRSWPSISPDGRILQTLSPSFFNYLTIFPDQLPPEIQCKYYIPDRPLPTAPGSSVVANAGAAAATYISSWFGSDTAKKWEPVSLDDVLGGPKRPPAKPKAQDLPITENTPTPSGSSSAGTRSRLQLTGPQTSRDRVKEVEVEYNAFGMPKKRHELTDALEERGEKLDFLNQHLDNASQASQDFLSQARRTAMLQSAKGAATGVGKGAMYSINKMLS